MEKTTVVVLCTGHGTTAPENFQRPELKFHHTVLSLPYKPCLQVLAQYPCVATGYFYLTKIAYEDSDDLKFILLGVDETLLSGSNSRSKASKVSVHCTSGDKYCFSKPSFFYYYYSIYTRVLL
jgi:hypothetical protein